MQGGCEQALLRGPSAVGQRHSRVRERGCRPGNVLAFGLDALTARGEQTPAAEGDGGSVTEGCAIGE